MPYWVRTILVTVPAEDLREAREGHLEHLRGLAAEGSLRAAGEFRGGEGFLEIFEAEDLHAAERVARSSPVVAEGLGTWMLREWVETPL